MFFLFIYRLGNTAENNIKILLQMCQALNPAVQAQIRHGLEFLIMYLYTDFTIKIRLTVDV